MSQATKPIDPNARRKRPIKRGRQRAKALKTVRKTAKERRLVLERIAAGDGNPVELARTELGRRKGE